jgi:hypothetical protein
MEAVPRKGTSGRYIKSAGMDFRAVAATAAVFLAMPLAARPADLAPPALLR